MKSWVVNLISVLALAALVAAVFIFKKQAQPEVPNELQQPGTQSGEVTNLETPDSCAFCHSNYDAAVEPYHNWSGSMMANAGRDPVFWATLAVAESDYKGAGDFCLRCHSTFGWYNDRSKPTDGSALAATDTNGLDCSTCHKMTNPDNSEHLGVMNPPFQANDKKIPATAYFGSGMLSLSADPAKLGPYSDAQALHPFAQSKFHRDVNFCGACHDVSNPVVGDLAHNHGVPSTADPVVSSGVPGAPLEEKAAFNNFPYQYGVIEQTFSEYTASSLSKTLVSSYESLPADLQAGAIQFAYERAGGDYADGTPRYFSCQTCHLAPTTGQGANKPGLPTRSDLPQHDLTGGSYWVADAIQYQESQGTLRLGGGLTDKQIKSMDDGKQRSQAQLSMAAALSVDGNTLKVTNLTAHKLISGYPEGRRMWLNIKWYDKAGTLLREDGKYDVVTEINETPVKSIVDLADPNTKIYEIQYGLTQEWAKQLIDLGSSPKMALSYNRQRGAVDYTLGQLADQPAGTAHKTFHFVLNNTLIEDNRIPPYGMTYDAAAQRNTLPAPAGQYGNPAAGGTFNYWDEIALNPPDGAVSAEIKLLYQSTSWEYIQFVYLANNGKDAFLAKEGVNLLNAWLNTGMSEPFVMATTTWSGHKP
jgi:hypothetical protein